MSKIFILKCVLLASWFMVGGGIAAILILVPLHVDHTAFDSIWGIDASLWMLDNKSTLWGGAILATLFGLVVLVAGHGLVYERD